MPRMTLQRKAQQNIMHKSQSEIHDIHILQFTMNNNLALSSSVLRDIIRMAIFVGKIPLFNRFFFLNFLLVSIAFAVILLFCDFFVVVAVVLRNISSYIGGIYDII